MTTSVVRRTRGSSLHVDVKLSIPCLPTLDSADGSDKAEEDNDRASGSVAIPSLPTVLPGIPAINQAAAAAPAVSANSTPKQPASMSSIPSDSSSPLAHVVKSRPRPLMRKHTPMSAGSHSNNAVLGELPINKLQPNDGTTAAAAASAHPPSPNQPSNEQNEPSSVATATSAPAAKPRRSQLMSAMMDQRDRKRRDDMRRKEDEMARMQHMQQQMARQPALSSSTQPAHHTATTAQLIQRTLGSSTPHSVATDMSTTLREDKRKRDVEGQRLRERRAGLRDRMKEVGVAATPTATNRTPTTGGSKGMGQSPQTDNGGGTSSSSSGSSNSHHSSASPAVPDSHRQSILPCTFHTQPEDEAVTAATADMQLPQTLSLDDIMAGRVNYQ